MSFCPPFHSTAAFLRTPKEVFASIFELVAEDRSITNIRTICLVCRAWHTLAISLPKLWSFLPVSRNTSPVKLALWIQRSREQALHIIVPAPEVDSLKGGDPIARKEYLHDVLLQSAMRWGTLIVDCLQLDQDNSRGLSWVGKLEGRALHRLETLNVLLWAPEVEFPSSCSLPRLRYLTLGRGTCRWTLTIIPLASSSLRSLTLKNIQLPYALSVSEMLRALHSAPGLECLQVDEVEWTYSNPTEYLLATINLPKLISLSLTSVDNVLAFIQPLQIPHLTELVIGDVNDDLGPVFREFVQKTSSIMKLTTGLWEEEFTVESESGLIALLEKQRTLQSLSVGHAPIDKVLIQQLTCVRVTDGVLCPELVSLQLPASLVSPQAVRTMVKSRFAAGIRLEFLSLVGGLDGIWDQGDLTRYVGQLKMEDGDNAE